MGKHFPMAAVQLSQDYGWIISAEQPLFQRKLNLGLVHAEFIGNLDISGPESFFFAETFLPSPVCLWKCKSCGGRIAEQWIHTRGKRYYLNKIFNLEGLLKNTTVPGTHAHTCRIKSAFPYIVQYSHIILLQLVQKILVSIVEPGNKQCTNAFSNVSVINFHFSSTDLCQEWSSGMKCSCLFKHSLFKISFLRTIFGKDL